MFASSDLFWQVVGTTATIVGVIVVPFAAYQVRKLKESITEQVNTQNAIKALTTSNTTLSDQLAQLTREFRDYTASNERHIQAINNDLQGRVARLEEKVTNIEKEDREFLRSSMVKQTNLMEKMAAALPTSDTASKGRRT